MKKISEHLGEIIVALAGVALIVAACVAFRTPIGNFFQGIVAKETNVGNEILANVGDVDLSVSGAQRIDLNSILLWENGHISASSGEHKAGATYMAQRARSKTYLSEDISEIVSNANDDYYFAVYLFDKNTSAYQGRVGTSGEIVPPNSDAIFLSYCNLEEYSDQYSIRIVVMRHNDTDGYFNISIDDILENYSLYTNKKLVRDSVNGNQRLLQKNASVFSGVKYTPIRNLPKATTKTNAAVYFSAGKEMQGIPYSISWDGMVGYNVSLETYLTAIKNPNSVLYTNNLHGTVNNAATYYGTLCSSVGSFLIGEEAIYQSDKWSLIENNELVTDNITSSNLKNLKTGDTIYHNNSNHIIVITDILRDETGEVKYIELTASEVLAYPKQYNEYDHHVSKIIRKLYSAEQFVAYADSKTKFEVYRNSLDTAPNQNMLTVPTKYNTDLMVDRGAKSNYPEGSSVEFTMYDIESKPFLLLYKDGSETPVKAYNLLEETLTDGYSDATIAENKILSVDNLSVGKYKACLSTINTSGGAESDKVEFNICKMNVSVSGDTNVTINISGENLKPVYISWVSSDESEVPITIYKLSEQEIEAGVVTLAKKSSIIRIYGENEFGQMATRVEIS